jgi:hypothetical protein
LHALRDDTQRLQANVIGPSRPALMRMPLPVAR